MGSEYSIKTEQQYALSQKSVIGLFIYYGTILCLGVVASIIILHRTYDIEVNADNYTVYYYLTSALVAICGSLTFSSFYYIRKLYKICIREKLATTEGGSKKIGYLAYFITRPFFACLLSTFCCAAMLSGIFVVSGTVVYALNERFVALSYISSCCLGFSIGKVINSFEKESFEKYKGFAGVTSNDGE